MGGGTETKRQTMEMGEMEVGNGVDARNLSVVPKTGSENRTPNFGKLPGQQESSVRYRNWSIPNYSEQEYAIWEQRNHKRYEDYGVKKIGRMAQV